MKKSKQEARKISVAAARELFRLLAKARVDRMDTESQYKFIRHVMGSIKAIFDEFENFIRQANETKRPEGWRESQEDRGRWAELSEERRAEIIRIEETYEREVNAVVEPMAREERELGFEALSEKEFKDLMASNPDWTVGQRVAVAEVLCGK